jgi:Cytosol aminopeptidase family, N-terminal domain
MAESFSYDGISVHVLAESPAVTRTDLQVICLFEGATAKPITGSLSVIDLALNGILTELLTSGGFEGRLGETLLLSPSAERIGASQLLLVGIGAADAFTSALETRIGAMVATQAMFLGVPHPFYAPSILDGGVEYPARDIPDKFIGGVLRSIRTARLLRSRGLLARPIITDVTLLTGKAHFLEAVEAVRTSARTIKG